MKEKGRLDSAFTGGNRVDARALLLLRGASYLDGFMRKSKLCLQKDCLFQNSRRDKDSN